MTDSYRNWFDKNKFKNILAILIPTNVAARIKQANSSILTLKTWLLILKIIELVKYLLKKDLNTLNELKNAGITKQKNTLLNRKNY